MLFLLVHLWQKNLLVYNTQGTTLLAEFRMSLKYYGVIGVA